MISGDARTWAGTVHVSVVRNAVALTWLVIGIFVPLEAYSHFDESLFKGYGIGAVLLADDSVRSILTSHATLLLVRLGLVLTSAWTLVTSRLQRQVGIALIVFAVLFDSVVKGIGGFANHAQTVPLLALGVVMIVPHSKCMSLLQLTRLRTSVSVASRAQEYDRLALTLISLAVLLPYSFMGLERVVVGGSQMFVGDVLLRYLAGASAAFQTYPDWLPIQSMKGFLNSGFFVTTALEALSLVVLVSRMFRIAWLMWMLLFHISTLLLMNVLFWENLLISAALFWPWWSEPLRETPVSQDASGVTRRSLLSGWLTI